jgi:hypothetical protein
MFTPKAIMGISIGLLASLVAFPAAALTQKECSEKYQVAKAAGTLGDKSWNDFRKECAANGATATTAPETKPAAAKEPAQKKPSDAKSAAKSAAPSNAAFPSAVSSKYAKESAGRARMHTCLAQYNANKATNANGGLKWIMKGGGYYSECNKRLKS